MAITLGPVTFDAAYTQVREKHEEVGGRNERLVELSGLIVGESTPEAIGARLDAILDAASAEDYSAELSLRTGRRLYVRRESFTREVAAERLAGSFMLRVRAREPFEESTALTSVEWPVSASGATQAVASAGNVFAKPVITLVASGDIVEPAFSDGVRTIAYAGVVADGETLVFDAEGGRVTLDGEDVTPYTSGDFPQIAPEGVTLTYTDGEASSHTASVTVAFRDRWW